MFSMFAALVALPLNSAIAITAEEWETMRQAREEQREERMEARETRIEARQERRENRLEKRCEQIQSRIETRLNRYENNGSMLETVYGNLNARLERLIERLKNKGADTTQLEADFETLKNKINDLLAQHESFMETLEAAAEITCSEVDQENSTETKEKMGEARKVFETIKQKRIEIRDFVKNTIKPDILAIREKLAEDDDASESETE